MYKLTTLLAAATLAATACSGGDDTIVESEAVPSPVETTAPPTTPATSPAPPSSTAGVPDGDADAGVAVAADDDGATDAMETAAATDATSGAVTVETTIDFDAQRGTFEVTEGADLLGCRSGTVIEYEGPSGITDEFTCDDGERSGGFVVRWAIIDGAEGPGDVNGSWEVVDTRGDFAGLTGEGSWSGVSDGAIGHGSFPGTIAFGDVDEVDGADDPSVASGDPVEAFIGAAVSDVYVPDHGSVLAAIVEPDGSVVAAVHDADAEQATIGVDDPVRVGSNTKTFTAVLVLGLVDGGLVDLDAPAADYIERADVPADVTVRHLLQHRSGLASYTDDEAFFEESKTDPSRVFTPVELVERVADADRSFEPGSEFEYSNTNYILLGLLIEDVTGESYDAVLRSRIVEPLGLSSTFLSDGDDERNVADAYTAFYTGSLDPITADYTSIATGAWSAGALVSTAADMHVFFTALFAGDLIADELIAEMTTARDGYGLGIMTDWSEFGADELLGHSGGIIGFSTMALHSPTTGRTGFWVATEPIDARSAISAVAPLLAAESLTAAIAVP